MKTNEEEFTFEDEVIEVPERTRKRRTYQTDAYEDEYLEGDTYNIDMSKEKISDKDAGVRWDNRRRMAWISLVSMIIITLLMMFVVDTSKLDSLEVVITWFYMGCVSVIGSYIGFTTYASIKGVREKR
jgi:hypothetical protein